MLEVASVGGRDCARGGEWQQAVGGLETRGVEANSGLEFNGSFACKRIGEMRRRAARGDDMDNLRRSRLAETAESGPGPQKNNHRSHCFAPRSPGTTARGNGRPPARILALFQRLGPGCRALLGNY